MTSQSKVIIADYTNPLYANDLILLLNHYAPDPMSDNETLAEMVKQNLVGELAKIPKAFSLLYYVNNKAAGLINCF